MAQVAPDVVIIDTLRECCTGADENDSTDMQAVIAHLTAACQPAAMVLVAHAKKPPAEGSYSVVTGNRGSSYVTGKMDAICHFSHNSMTIIGRACEETKVGLEKVEIEGGFYWKLNGRSEAKELARELLADSSFTSDRARARRLSELTGKDEEACRKIISRVGQPA